MLGGKVKIRQSANAAEDYNNISYSLKKGSRAVSPENNSRYYAGIDHKYDNLEELCKKGTAEEIMDLITNKK